MRVDEVMQPAECVREEATVGEVAKLMRDRNIGFVPVCNEDGEPVGAVTDRDLAVRILAAEKGPAEPIEDAMTDEVVSVEADDDIGEVERKMQEERISRVMVCDEGGRLVGVVSLQDVAEATSEEEAGRTLQGVKSEGPQPGA